MRTIKNSINMTGNQNRMLKVPNPARTNWKKNQIAARWTPRQMVSETQKDQRRLLRCKKITMQKGIKVPNNAVTHFGWNPLLCALPAATNANTPIRARIVFSQIEERLLIESLLSLPCMRCTPHARHLRRNRYVPRTQPYLEIWPFWR